MEHTIIKSTDERLMILSQTITRYTAFGARVLNKEDNTFTAVLLQPAPKINHALHAVLTLITAGLWLLIWLIIILANGKDKRFVISVNEYGVVQTNFI